MTNVTVRFHDQGYSLTSIGHAGTTASCAAVSALVQALAGWVHNGHSGGISLDKGEAIIAIPKQDGADAVMDLIVIGLLQIQKAAPDDVSVIVEIE